MIRRSMQDIFFSAAMKRLGGNAYYPNEKYLVIKY
jgi:hypothetical protein